MNLRVISYFVGIVVLISVSKAQDDYAPYTGERFDDFDWNLVRSLQSSSSGNVIISPLSIKIVLAMLYEASAGTTDVLLQEVLSLPVSRHNTRDRFLQVIHSLNSSSTDYSLDIGSRIFLDQSIRAIPQYEKILKNYYGSSITPVDFQNVEQTKHQINHWADNVTHGRVKQLANEDGLQDNVMVLANALFFKGLWRIPFEKSRNVINSFHLSPSQIQNVEFMISENNYFYSEFEALDSKVLRLPFRGNISMFIVLPNKIDGLRRVIKNLKPSIMTELRWSLEIKSVFVRIPKFSFEYKAELKSTLEDLGLKELFEDIAVLPAFQTVNNKNVTNVRVSNFVQKAGIEVNEEGSTAWAATEVDIGNRFSSRMFDANRPFLFFLEDEFTGNVLFVGKLENPLGDQQRPTNVQRPQIQPIKNVSQKQKL